MRPTLHVIRGCGDDVYRHLAAEDLLLRWAQEDRFILYFWQSRCAAVIGKNQNPWSEVWITRLRQEDGRLARRITGGGAVYHDLGNLNVSFFLPRQFYCREAIYQVLEAAIRAWGLEPQRIGRTGVGTAGQKISGHAFAFRGKAVLHHATLLVNADLDRLHRILRDGTSLIESRAVRSEHACVANLIQFVPDLSMEHVESTITEMTASFLQVEPRRESGLPGEVEKGLDAEAEQFASWDWVYGLTPPFHLRLQQRIASHDVHAQLNVKEGRIVSGFVHLETCNPPHVDLTLCRFETTDLHQRMRTAGWDENICSVVADALLNA